MNKLHRQKRLFFQLIVRALVGNENTGKHLNREKLVIELRIFGEPHGTHSASPKLTNNTISAREDARPPIHCYVVVDSIPVHFKSMPILAQISFSMDSGEIPPAILPATSSLSVRSRSSIEGM